MNGKERERRLRALHRSVMATLSGTAPPATIFNPYYCLDLFSEFGRIRDELIRKQRSLFQGFPRRPIPTPVTGTDFFGAGYIPRGVLETLEQDIQRCATLLGIDLENRDRVPVHTQERWWEKAWVYQLLSLLLAGWVAFQNVYPAKRGGELAAVSAASTLRQQMLTRIADYVEVTRRFEAVQDRDSLVLRRPEIVREIEVINADLNDIEGILAKRERRSPRPYWLPNPAAPAAPALHAR